MRKVETLNLLQDSNHLLRDERNRLSETLKDVEAKVSLHFHLMISIIVILYC